MKLDGRTTRQDRQLARLDADRTLPLADAVVMADHGGAVWGLNPAAEALFGSVEGATEPVPPTTATTSAGSWSPLDDDQATRLRQALALHGRWQGDILLRRRDGSALPASASACVLHGSPGLRPGIALVVRPLDLAPDVARTGGSGEPETTQVGGLPGSFCLHFQPEVRLDDGVAVGAEALMRWWHPGLGVLSPGPALAHPRWAPRLSSLAIWSVFAVCRQAAAWRQAGLDLTLAVNLSSHEVAEPEAVDRIRRAVAVTGIDPAAIAVDLPAVALLADARRFRRVAAELTDLGVGVVLDDLDDRVPAAARRGLTASAVKLAVRDGEVGLTGLSRRVERARAVAPDVIAKGVETAAEADAARAVGFDRALGYRFGAPVPPLDLAEHLWCRTGLDPGPDRA